jgi:AGZA family xanthine/uracil permease-like MFS transporter
MLRKIKESVNRLDGSFNSSRAGEFFACGERGSKLSTEFNAGTATFLTMAYILAVNPRILSESGGPCIPPNGDIFDLEYEMCMEEIKRQYITATAIGSMIGCFLMGLLANLPIALAPGEFILVHSSHTHVDDRIKTIQLELLKQEWA